VGFNSFSPKRDIDPDGDRSKVNVPDSLFNMQADFSGGIRVCFDAMFFHGCI
jgi:hypothetical protein